MDRDSYKSLAEAYQQIQENPLDALKRQAERYKRATQAVYRDFPQAVMQAGADVESGLTGNDASAKERERQTRLNDPRLRAVDRATDQQGLQPFGGQARMTRGEEDARTNIPRTDAQGNRVFTDADRPSGFHTIQKDGKDIRRYWDGKKWLVDKPGFRMGAETPNDPGAQAIRKQSNPLNSIPKVFNMQGIGSENPLDVIRDQAGKAWKGLTGQGPGPRDIKGTEDPLGLANVTGLKPKGEGGGTQTPASDTPSSDSQTDADDNDDTPTNRDGSDVTQKGPNSAGLTPMQQWAKNFPKLAAKVKPGQVGYDEIQKMNSGSSSSPTNVSRNFQSSAPNLGAQTNIPRAAPISTQPMKTTPAASNFNQASPNLGKAIGMKALASKAPKSPTPPKPPKPMNRLDQATTNVPKFSEEALLQSLSDAYNEISEARTMGRKRTPEEQAKFDKEMAPYFKAREANKKKRENAPGAKGIDWRKGEHHIGDYLRKDPKSKKKVDEQMTGYGKRLDTYYHYDAEDNNKKQDEQKNRSVKGDQPKNTIKSKKDRRPKS